MKRWKLPTFLGYISLDNLLYLQGGDKSELETMIIDLASHLSVAVIFFESEISE